MTADELLEQYAQLFRDKNSGDHYANNHHEFGKLAVILFPKGVELKTIMDFNQAGLMFMIIHKLMRLSKIIPTSSMPDIKFDKLGDNTADLSVYSAMLGEMIEKAEGGVSAPSSLLS